MSIPTTNTKFEEEIISMSQISLSQRLRLERSLQKHMDAAQYNVELGRWRNGFIQSPVPPLEEVA